MFGGDIRVSGIAVFQKSALAGRRLFTVYARGSPSGHGFDAKHDMPTHGLREGFCGAHGGWQEGFNWIPKPVQQKWPRGGIVVRSFQFRMAFVEPELEVCHELKHRRQQFIEFGLGWHEGAIV